MIKKTTQAIVLKRIDYGDYDRIITVLTPDLGKVSMMVKGVRKINSKLAGGIELFSIFDAGFISGRGEVGRLTSARLEEFYGNILNDISRVKLGYQILKSFDHNLEDNVESSYFYLLCQLLRLLNEKDISLVTIEIYFKSSMLMLAGHSPNLLTDSKDESLSQKDKYNLSVDSMSLVRSNNGRLSADHIKLLRLLFTPNEGQKIFRIKLSNNEDGQLKPLIDAMFSAYLSV